MTQPRTSFSPEEVLATPLRRFNPFQSAAFLDIETTGLEDSAAILEAALYDPRSKELKTWVLRPTGLTQAGTLEDISRAELANRSSPWFKQRAGPLGVFAELTGSTFGPSEAAIYAKKVQQGLLDIENKLGISGIKHRMMGRAGRYEVSFGEFFEDLLGILESKEMRGTVLGLHNVPFDLPKIGRLAAAHERAGLLSRETLQRWHQIFETSPALEAYRGQVFESGNLMQWAKAYVSGGGDPRVALHAMAGGVESAERVAVRDSLTLARAMIQVATGNVPVGTAAMDVMKFAFAIDTMNAHRAWEDVVVESEVAKRSWNIAERITSGVPLAREQAEFFSRISALSGPLAEEKYYKDLLEARAAIEEKKALRPRGRAGEASYRIRVGGGVAGRPMYAGEKIIQGLAPQGVFIEPKTMKEATAALREQIKVAGISINFSQLDKMAAAVPKELLEAEFNKELDLDKLFKTLSGSTPLKKAPMVLPTRVGDDSVISYIKTVIPKNVRGKVPSAAQVAFGLVGISALIALSKNKAKDDRHVDIEGLPEEGYAPLTRHAITEFGSGWNGILSAILPPSIMTSSWTLENRIERFNRTIWQVPGRRAAMEADLKEREKRAQEEYGTMSLRDAVLVQNLDVFEGMNPAPDIKVYAKRINPSQYDYYFDDADTLVLRRKGAFGLPTGDKMSIRLSGIDSPEVGGHEGDPLKPVRIAEEQPFGRSSAEAFRRIMEQQKSVTVLFSPDQMTYGRHLGVLFGDQGQNINLMMVKHGVAAYLPFGQAGSALVNTGQFAAAEKEAVASRRGMWKEPFWQGYKYATKAAGSSITFNTFTRLDRLANDRNLSEAMLKMWELQHQGYVTQDDIVEMGAEGNRLRYTFNRFGKKNKKRFQDQINTDRVAGDARYYNELPGLYEQGYAAEKRKQYGFGSGFEKKGLSTIIRMLKKTSPEWAKGVEEWETMRAVRQGGRKPVAKGVEIVPKTSILKEQRLERLRGSRDYSRIIEMIKKTRQMVEEDTGERWVMRGATDAIVELQEKNLVMAQNEITTIMLKSPMVDWAMIKKEIDVEIGRAGVTRKEVDAAMNYFIGIRLGKEKHVAGMAGKAELGVHKSQVGFTKGNARVEIVDEPEAHQLIAEKVGLSADSGKKLVRTPTEVIEMIPGHPGIMPDYSPPQLWGKGGAIGGAPVGTLPIGGHYVIPPPLSETSIAKTTESPDALRKLQRIIKERTKTEKMAHNQAVVGARQFRIANRNGQGHNSSGNF